MMCVDYLSISQYNYQRITIDNIEESNEINLIRTNTIKEKF